MSLDTAAVSVTLTLSDDLRALVQGHANPQQTWRRSVENRVRPRFNALAAQMNGATSYPVLQGHFRVRQQTDGEGVHFWIENDHPLARILLAEGGSRPHHISQAPHMIPLGKLIKWAGSEFDAKVAQHVLSLPDRTIEIDHPGLPEDAGVYVVAGEGAVDAVAITESIARYWAAKFGAEEV